MKNKKKGPVSPRYLPPVHLACSNDQLRLAMTYVYVEDGIAMATNMSILVRIRLSDVIDLPAEEIEHLNGKFIQARMWETMCKADTILIEPDGVVCQYKGLKSKMFFPQTGLKYPDAKAVLAKEKPFVAISHLAVSPRNLDIIHRVFLSPPNGVAMEFTGKNGLIRVVPVGDGNPGMCAICMPVTNMATQNETPLTIF